jgi:glucose-6-phosphate 1-epimerase
MPDPLRFEDTPNGLTRAIISTDHAEAELWLQGAHLTQWTPRGQRPVLFTSSRSLYEPGKPIRGGVPLVFPWFGPRGGGLPGPMHGIARIQNWKFENSRLRDDGALELEVSLASDDPAPFHLLFRVAIGARLEMELEVRNPAPAALTFEEAMHTYFAVGDIHQATVSGLEGTDYIDKTDNFQRKHQPAEPLRFAKETDQVHLNTAAACVIHDPAWNRRIVIEKSGSATTVVWNPWVDKTRTLPDMAPEDWRGMLCVETANAGESAVRLAPSASHRMRAAIHLQ